MPMYVLYYPGARDEAPRLQYVRKRRDEAKKVRGQAQNMNERIARADRRAKL